MATELKILSFLPLSLEVVVLHGIMIEFVLYLKLADDVVMNCEWSRKCLY